MWRRWIVYLAALAGCLAYYYAYSGWLSHLLLRLVLWLPWFSLLVSLPAIFTARFHIRHPAQVQMHEQACLEAIGQCRLPLPRFSYRLQATHCITGQSIRLKQDALPTEHCGTWQVCAAKLWVWDYLGLFRLPRRGKGCQLRVLPRPLTPKMPPAISRYQAHSFRPKAGGGFSEHHDLRLYRPGDNLRQIHWKLAAKTGKLIFREPILPTQELPVLVLLLRGSYDELDRLLGRLDWTMSYFLKHGLSFSLLCKTGNGLERFFIADRKDADTALYHLLCTPAAHSDDTLPEGGSCIIGGGENG